MQKKNKYSIDFFKQRTLNQLSKKKKNLILTLLILKILLRLVIVDFVDQMKLL